jgi:hypothetical protein
MAAPATGHALVMKSIARQAEYQNDYEAGNSLSQHGLSVIPIQTSVNWCNTLNSLPGSSHHFSQGTKNTYFVKFSRELKWTGEVGVRRSKDNHLGVD